MYFTVFQQGVQFRWNLKAANHRILADSGESYHNKSDCLDALNAVNGKNNFPVNDDTVPRNPFARGLLSPTLLTDVRPSTLLTGGLLSNLTPPPSLHNLFIANILANGIKPVK